MGIFQSCTPSTSPHSSDVTCTPDVGAYMGLICGIVFGSILLICLCCGISKRRHARNQDGQANEATNPVDRYRAGNWSTLPPASEQEPDQLPLYSVDCGKTHKVISPIASRKSKNFEPPPTSPPLAHFPISDIALSPLSPSSQQPPSPPASIMPALFSPPPAYEPAGRALSGSV